MATCAPRFANSSATSAPMRFAPVINATLSVGSMGWMAGIGWTGRMGRIGRMGRKEKRAERFPFQPVLSIPPAQTGRYRLKLPKKAEGLLGSLHLVPSAEPVNAF